MNLYQPTQVTATDPADGAPAAGPGGVLRAALARPAARRRGLGDDRAVRVVQGQGGRSQEEGRRHRGRREGALPHRQPRPLRRFVY